jgi:ribokinase
MWCLYSDGSEHARAEAFRVNPVDTTAAGDEFNSALSVVLAEGASLSWINIRPTIAKSREVRKLDQKRATASTASGTIKRLGVFTRS